MERIREALVTHIGNEYMLVFGIVALVFLPAIAYLMTRPRF
jgi:hypothetical protein